jgi:uncharacterized membrane protein
MPSADSRSLEERLAIVEARLERIERRMFGNSDVPAPATVSRFETGTPPRRDQPSRPSPSASAWLAWSGSIAFVLAATYFLKLVYDSGWLTPERQIGLAVLAGIALIVAGLQLARVDRPYAGYLPAAGVVVLYAAVYAAHAYYHMLQSVPAIFAVGAVTLLSIWLHRRFEQTMFAIFAVVGTYVFPLLIDARSTSITDLIIYFGAWGLLFSLASVLEGKRTIYLFALYFSLVGFDIAWRQSVGFEAWAAACTFQFVQFMLFAATATWFSVAHGSPMNPTEAWLHGGALFYFYVVEYIMLEAYAPELAPFVALATVVVALALYFLARTRLESGDGPGASAVLVSAYAAAVTTHVVFFELTPGPWKPCVALLWPLATVLARPLFRHRVDAFLPVALIAAGVFAIGLLALVGDDTGTTFVASDLVLYVYAGALYLAYLYRARVTARSEFGVFTLYAGHIAFMIATVRSFDSGLLISAIWGVFAVALLMLAIRTRDKLLGQSSLLIFAASVLKILLLDLTGSPSIVRVATLAVAGATLYAGGWLYQRVVRDD